MRGKTVNLFFWSFIILYFFIVFYKANLGVTDTFLFNFGIFKNNPFISLSDGRFALLNGVEYTIIKHFIFSPVAFYFYNALQLLLVSFFLYKTFIKIDKNILFVYFVILVFILSPGFVTSWLRGYVAERNLVFFFVIFLYFYLKFQDKPKILFMLIVLVSANIALYYKEPGFCLLGVFSFFHLAFGWKGLTLRRKLLDIALILSSIVFILIYFFCVYRFRGPVLYGDGSWQPFFYSFSIFISYILNDPLIFLNIIFFLWRFFSFLKKKYEFNILYDSMSLATILYCFAFIKMKIYNPYYLLPAYVFALPALIFYFGNINWREKVSLKIASVITLFLIVFSSLPAGIHWFSFYKNIPHNYQKTLDFLEPYIRDEFAKEKCANIFLYGIYRNSNSEVYNSFRLFLCEYKKLPTESFDLKTDIEFNKNNCPSENSPYSFWNKREIDKIEKGDLLIVTPYTYKNFYKESFDEYETIFRTNSPIAIPDISLRAIIKYIVSNYIRKNSNNPGMYSNKFLGLPQDFYVLRKIR